MVIGASVVAGLFLATYPAFTIPQFSLEDSVEDLVLGDLDDGTGAGQQLERTHEHALFYVVVNGTELDFRSPEYQYNSPYVHLENNRSHIVHKHIENVTWQQFLDTINVSIEERDTGYCLETVEMSRCGNGTVVLNDEENPDLGQVIRQGDKFLIVLQGDVSSIVNEYALKELPSQYTPGFGHRV